MRKIEEIEHLGGRLREVQRAVDASAAELHGARGACAQAAERLHSLQQGHAAAMQQVCISSISKPEWTHEALIKLRWLPMLHAHAPLSPVTVAYLCLLGGDMLRP
jgi:hypothetical protein